MASETYVGQKSNAHVLQSENPLLPNGRDNPQAVAMFAEALFKARHVFFPQGYFTDVSWQILLELFLARQTHTKVIVSDLCLEPKIARSWMGMSVEFAIRTTNEKSMSFLLTMATSS
jgi:hypothetical protein